MSSRTPSSRTPSSSSQSSSSRSSRSQSVSPTSQRFVSRLPNLLYVYIGLAAFFLIAILSHSISPPQMFKISPNCENFTGAPLPNDNLSKTILSIIKENMTQNELLEIVNSNNTNETDRIYSSEDVTESLKKLLRYVDNDGKICDCRIPINTNGFFFVAFLLFALFVGLAALSYYNNKRKTE